MFLETDIISRLFQLTEINFNKNVNKYFTLYQLFALWTIAHLSLKKFYFGG